MGNLARALASAPEDKSSVDESVQSLLTGIELSWTEIQSAIEKHGVRQINPVGEKFDYNFHQAMFEVPTNDQPPGMVLDTRKTRAPVPTRGKAKYSNNQP